MATRRGDQAVEKVVNIFRAKVAGQPVVEGQTRMLAILLSEIGKSFPRLRLACRPTPLGV